VATIKQLLAAGLGLWVWTYTVSRLYAHSACDTNSV